MTNNVSLTPQMTRVLSELSKQGVVAHYMPHAGHGTSSYYFLTSTHERCTAQIRALLKRGLVEKYDCSQFGDRHKVRITKQGRKIANA